MKRVLSTFSAAVLFVLLATPVVEAQGSQMVPGTQVRLTLVQGLSTAVAHDGDPFTAIVAEPVFVGSKMVLPAGARLHGQLADINRPKMFSMFRGGASMNLVFRSVEIESRIFPVQMSILSIYNGTADSSKKRGDVKTVEGVVVQEKRDIKGDVMNVGMGTAAGSVVGLVFSNVVRGTVLGLVGGGAYIVAKKGKEVELPAETGMLVRLDSTLSLPDSLLRNASYASGGR
ncbi:MAG: hypothetical protein WBF56_03030 [Candidatus Acidiferrales bacterium]